MTESILAKLVVQISAQTAAFNTAIAVSKKELGSLQASVQSVNKTLQTFGIGFGISEVVGAIRSGINDLAQFEQQVATVGAITGATGPELDKLRAAAVDLGASTKFTSKEVAELQTEFGRLGFSTQEILNATDATLALAAATGEDLAKSADITGSTLRAFGIDASEAGRVADVMAESFNASALGLDNYGEAIKYVAPIAASANISLEETTALLGTLADNGIRGSMAGTSLRKIISDLGGESGTLAEKLQSLAAKGLSQADAMDEVGRTAYASLLILAKNTDKTKALAGALNDSAGAAQRAADAMSNNLNGDLEKLSGAYDSLIISGGAFTESLRTIAQALTNLLNAANNGSGFFKILDKIINYTPNIVTLAKAINFLSDGLLDNAQEVDKLLKNAYAARTEAQKTGNQKLFVESTKLIIELTNRYKLLKDKAVEANDSIAKGSEFAGVTVDRYTSLQAHLADLNEQFEATDLSDTKRLAQIGQFIIATEAEIEKIDKLREAEKEKNDEKRKSIALYDAERASILGVAEAYNRNQEEIKRNQETVAKFLEGINPLGSKGIAKNLERQIQDIKNALDVTFDPSKTIRYREQLILLEAELQNIRTTGKNLADEIRAGKVGISDGLARQIKALKPVLSEGKKTIVDFTSLTQSAIQDFATIIGEGIGGGFENFGKKMLAAVAGFAQQFGALLIAMGVAKTAFETSLSGPQLIIAGAALVAAGAAVKAHLAKQKNVTKGVSLSGGGGGGGSPYSARSTGGGGSVQDRALTATVVLKGQDIYLAFKNYEENKRYTAATAKTVTG